MSLFFDPPRRNFLRRNLVKLLLIASLFIGGLLLMWMASLSMPDFNAFTERKVQSSTKIYDRTGKVLLYDVHENIQRTVIPGADMGVNIKNATIAIEDSDFYQHRGIKPTAILRAVITSALSPITGKNVQGGSTITQQVIKNSLLTSDKSISRKLKEWVLALKLERQMSKEEILALYLNEAPYGGNVYGIAEASRIYFGKEARDLTLAESAYMAALPQAPTYYSPYGKNKNKLDDRERVVLARMKELGFINDEEYKKAVSENVVFLPGVKGTAKAMHFVLFVKDYLEQKYGQDVLESGGLKVITTLDYEMQSKAEDIVKKYANDNKAKFNASNAALVAIDPKTGDILTMVGSRDYFDKEIDGNFNVTTAHRQPGSSFKPFVYATAFKKGYTPNTVLFDVKTEFQSTCSPDGDPLYGTKAEDCYMPENYDGKFLGPISIRDALAQSRNIPAIKALYLAGIKDSINTARSMGIKGLDDPDRYGLTLVLGGGEVSLLDMTSAYSVFANSGVRNQYQGVLKVTDLDGNTLEEASSRPAEVLPKNIALQISDILSDDKAREPEFGLRSSLYVDHGDVAAKTGTTNDYRDAWILGYTPSLAVGAWAGNNDNSPMQKKIAGFIIAPLWHEFMVEALKTYPVERFEKPEPVDSSVKPILRGLWQGGEIFTVDKISGKLATEYTPKDLRVEKPILNIHSILYWVDKNNPTGPYPTDPSSDPQFRLWEPAIQKWLKNNPVYGYSQQDIPTQKDDIHTPESAPKISIIEPTQNSLYPATGRINIKITSSGKFPLSKVDYYINNVFVGSSNYGPFNFSFSPKELDALKNTNELRVVGYDSVLNKGESVVNFNIAI